MNTTNASRRIPSNRKEVGKLVEQIQSLLNNNNTCITSNICINSNRICPKIFFSHFSIRLKLPNIFFRRRRVPQNKIMMKAAAAEMRTTMTVMTFANGSQAVESDRCRQIFSLLPIDI